MEGYGRRVDGGLVVRGICDCEVGQSGDADGRRVSDRRSRNRVRLRGRDWFGWRGLRRFYISVGKSQGCGNWSRSGIILVHAGLLWFSCGEYRWGRKTLPVMLP